MHLIPPSLDTKIGRSLASRHFPPPTASDLSFDPHAEGLKDEELRFFARNGYLVRRDVIPAELADFARRFARTLCPRHFQRAGRNTWRGRIRDRLSMLGMRRRSGHLKFRENVRDQRWLYELVANNRSVTATARALLGGGVQKPEGVRGLYSVFPSGVSCDKRPRPDTDSHPFLLGTATYLSDVEPQGGGFTVWPGSHLTMRWGYRTTAGSQRTGDYHRRLYKMAQMQPAVEITGSAGTTIFWHHRLAHGSSFNLQNHPRHALVVDFSTEGIDRLIRQPTTTDPWREWAIQGEPCID